MKPNTIDPEIAALLPQWQTRVPTAAALITGILPKNDHRQRRAVCFQNGPALFQLAVTDEWINENKPEPGKMLVVYADMTVLAMDAELFHSIYQNINFVIDERKQLARWKEEALTVMGKWDKVDALIRKHPDCILGHDVSDTAIKFINERDEMKEANRHLFDWQNAVLGSFDPSCNVTKELSSVMGRTFIEVNSRDPDTAQVKSATSPEAKFKKSTSTDVKAG